MKEIRAVHATKSITIIHNNSKVLDPQAVRPDLNKVKSSWSSPPTNPKLSVSLEKELKLLKIDVVHNDRVKIPANPSGPSDWDGSFGLQSSLKSVTLESGKKIEADYIFISVGNKPNVSLVEEADSGAIISGLVGVNEYLQVSQGVLTRGAKLIEVCRSSPQRGLPRHLRPIIMRLVIAVLRLDGKMYRALEQTAKPQVSSKPASIASRSH